MLACVLLQRVGRAHIGHQVARGKYAADIGGSDRAAVGAQNAGITGDAFRRQRNVVGDDDITCGNCRGNPDVGGVWPVSHDHEVDQRVRIGPDPAIADHHRAAAMANGDVGDLILHRTGVGINVNGRHDRNKRQSADAQDKVMWPAGGSFA